MIEGLKVSIAASELQALATKRAEHHDERAAVYAGQVSNMEAAKVEGMSYSGGDPVKALTDKRQQHAAEGAEMRFIAAHLDPAETYVLDRQDLHRLGIAASNY